MGKLSPINKYKEKPAAETIRDAQKLFKNINVELSETLEACDVSNTYRSTLKGYYNGELVLVSCGKGTTEEYCSASGYAEMIEYMQNHASHYDNFAFHPPAFRDKIIHESGFLYSPSERYVAFNEAISLDPLLKRYVEKQGTGLVKTAIDTPYCHVQNNRFAVAPLVALVNGIENPHLCLSSFNYINGTTGMAAGNSLEEALVQAISEVIERHIQRQLVAGEVTPNRFSDDFLKGYPNQFQMIEEIRSHGYICEVLDLSEDGMPCVVTVVTDPKSCCYHLRLGVFPVFEIAFERSITEILQLSEIRSLFYRKKFLKPSKLINPDVEYSDILSLDYGTYSESLFASRKYVMHPASQEAYLDPSSSTEEFLAHYISYFKSRNIDLYYFDYSTEYFSSVGVISPDMMAVLPLHDRLANMEPFYFQLEIIDALVNKNYGQLKDPRFMSRFFQYNTGMEASLQAAMWSLHPQDFKIDNNYNEYMSFCLLLIHGQYEAALEYLSDILIDDEYDKLWPKHLSKGASFQVIGHKATGLTDEEIEARLNSLIHDKVKVKAHVDSLSTQTKIIDNFLFALFSQPENLARRKSIEDYYITKNKVLFKKPTERTSFEESITESL